MPMSVLNSHMLLQYVSSSCAIDSMFVAFPIGKPVSTFSGNALSPLGRRSLRELRLEPRIGAQRVRFEDLRLVMRGEAGRAIDIALGIVEILPRLRIDAAHRAHHLGSEQDVVDR